jgi:hypothetical protein
MKGIAVAHKFDSIIEEITMIEAILALIIIPALHILLFPQTKNKR